MRCTFVIIEEKINSGDPWDLCFTASWGGINFYENARKGAYADLTELLPELAPETSSLSTSSIFANQPLYWDMEEKTKRL